MDLGSTQPITRMGTWEPPGGKGGLCVGLTILPPSCADYLKILGVSTSWSPGDLSRACTGITVRLPCLCMVKHDLIFMRFFFLHEVGLCEVCSRLPSACGLFLSALRQIPNPKSLYTV